MRSSRHGSSPSTPSLDNAFSPSYLALLRERNDVLTAAEAEFAGLWKIEPVPGWPARSPFSGCGRTSRAATHRSPSSGISPAKLLADFWNDVDLWRL